MALSLAAEIKVALAGTGARPTQWCGRVNLDEGRLYR